MVEANNSSLATVITDNNNVMTSLLASASSDFNNRYETADKVVANAQAKNGTGDYVTELASMPVTTHIIVSYVAVSVRSVVNSINLPNTFLNGLTAMSININGVTETSIKTDSISLISKLDSAIISDADKVTTQAVVERGGTSESSDTTILSVKSFSLANSTYGTQNGNDFVLHSLAPVFKIEMNSAMTKSLTNAVNIFINHGSNSRLLTTGNVTVSDDDDLNFYILGHNSGALKTDSSFELAPGELYTYTIEANPAFALQLDSGVSSSGNFKVADVTFTIPFENFSFNQSQVALNSVYKGLSAQNTLLQVNTTYPIQYSSSSSTTTDFGLLNYFPIDLGTNKSGNVDNINFFDVLTTTETGTASWLQGYDMIFSANLIESGNITIGSNLSIINYDSNNDGVADGNVSDLNWTIPNFIYIDKQ